jgi:hypothetical protein
MAELVGVDRALAQALNHAAQPQPLALLALLVATFLAAGPALLLAVLAIQALRRRDPASLAVVVLTGLGEAAVLLGHRPQRRPAQLVGAAPSHRLGQGQLTAPAAGGLDDSPS